VPERHRLEPGTSTASAKRQSGSAVIASSWAPPELWPTIRNYGLGNAIALNGMPDPVFARGLNNLRNHEEVIARTCQIIDQCAEHGVPNVIAFTATSGWTPMIPRR